MPFKECKVKGVTLDEKQLTYLYEEFFCKAIKSYDKGNMTFANVSRLATTRGNFVKDIIGNLLNADLVVADLTGLNPNVFYELGIRHTLKNGTLLLTQDLSSLPADLKNYIAFEYEYPPDASKSDDYYKHFENKMHTAIDGYVKDPDKPDNPVKDFLGIKHIIKDEQRKKDILINITFLRHLQINYIHGIRRLIGTLFNWKNGINAPLYEFSIGIEPILNRMVTLGESLGLIAFLQNFISSQIIIIKNQEVVHEALFDTNNIEIARKNSFDFTDYNFKKYHVLDLMAHYDTSEDNFAVKELDPISLSFNHFIEQYEIEIREIDK